MGGVGAGSGAGAGVGTENWPGVHVAAEADGFHSFALGFMLFSSTLLWKCRLEEGRIVVKEEARYGKRKFREH